MATSKPAVSNQAGPLLAELRGLIDAARQHVAQTANATLTMLYWQVGQRIRQEVLKDGRASYGEEILPTLSAKLVRDYGQGFSARNLARMVQFAEVFSDQATVVTLSQHLSWSHFIEILPLKQPLEREFYAEMCRIERWSVRTLRERIAGQLYLRWLDKHDRAAGEEPPIGLILCASQDAEQVELMDLGSANIRVAEYLAHIPDMAVLQAQLHRAVLLARERAPRAVLSNESPS